MNIIIVSLIVLAAAFFLWRVLSRKQETEKPVTYVCPKCGEHHCDCHRENESTPWDPDPRPLPWKPGSRCRD